MRVAKAGELTNPDGRPVCGAETRICGCGHHMSAHAYREETKTHRGKCAHGGCGCEAFAGRPHMQSKALMPNGRCRQHGGASLSGPAHPAWRGKGRSQWMPEDLLPHYEEAANDPDLLSLRDEIAVLRGQLRLLLSQFRDGAVLAKEAQAAASDVFAARRDLHAAQRGGDPTRLAEALTRLDQAIAELQGAFGAAGEQRDREDRSVKLALALERLERSENMRLVELHNMISAEKAISLLNVFTQAVVEVINAQPIESSIKAAVRRATADRLVELVGRRGPEALGPGRADERAAGPASAH